MSESSRNVWEKLQTIRCELQRMALKKSGYNDYSGYYYYELGDFLPAINELMLTHKLTTQITYSKEVATLTIINCEKPEETIIFTSPMAEASLRAAHPIQNLGAVETYQRRYLYMTAFEIVECDALDSIQGKEKKQTTAKKKTPVRQARRNENLSDATRKTLYKQISNFQRLTGEKDVIKALEKSAGKSMLEITEEDAVKLGNILQKWSNDYLASK